MTSPSAAPAAGGQRQRPQAKSGPRESKTTGRHELSRHARFAEISPAVGVLDEQALHRALAPAEHAILSFAGSVDVIRPLVSDIVPAAVAERLLRLRGHGVTRLADALQAAHEQLARARAPRRVVILLSDCRSTEDDDTVEAARALPELIILAPADDHEQAAQLAEAASARWAAIEHPLDAAAVLDRLLETRPATA